MKSFGAARNASREATIQSSSSADSGTRSVKPAVVVNVLLSVNPAAGHFDQLDACYTSGDTADPGHLTFRAIVDRQQQNVITNYRKFLVEFMFWGDRYKYAIVGTVVLLSCLSACIVDVLWPNGWMNQDTTWYGGRPRPRRHCVRWRPSSPTERGTVAPLPLFGPCLLWPVHLSNC